MTDDNEAAARVALDLAKSEVEQAFAITDRIEGKARSLMTVGGASFAVAQATAVPLLRDFPASASHWWRWLIVGSLAGSAVMLLCALAASGAVWWARKQKAVSVTMMKTLIAGDLAAGPARIAAKHLIEVLEGRRTENEKRTGLLKIVFAFWLVATVFAVAEIVVAALGGIYA